jgi:glycosyl transferase family 11
MIVRLQGGLGNQMFQYAYGVSEAAKRGEEIFFDRSGIELPRTYALDPFKLPIEFKDNSPDAEVGYWQSEKRFDHEKIRRAFLKERPQLSMDEGPFLTRTCFVHVRLTDYLNDRALAFHGNLLDTDYYQRAMAYVRERMDPCHFFVYTDDPAWFRKNVRWPGVSLVEGNPPEFDLWYMSECAAAIIANSSFSFWGAWLGPQKLVVAPKRWFTVDVAGAEDIVPDRWTKI